MAYWWKKYGDKGRDGDVRPNHFICISGCISSQAKILWTRLKKHTRHSAVPSDVQVCHHQSYIHQGLSTLSMGWDDSQLDTYIHTCKLSLSTNTPGTLGCRVLMWNPTATTHCKIAYHTTTICQDCMNEAPQKIQRTSQENIATFKGYIYIVDI